MVYATQRQPVMPGKRSSKTEVWTTYPNGSLWNFLGAWSPQTASKKITDMIAKDARHGVESW